MAKITINDIEVDVPDGTSIIAAADQAGVFVPRFCYHPDLSPAGNCRICQVEVDGSPRLSVSCMTAVRDGMSVRTDTEKVKKAVQGDLEFLLLNHPVDCPICDQAGECYLQDFYMSVGLHESRVPLTDKVLKRKVVDLGPMIVLDSERCVMCSRCIRFSDEVTGTNQFGFFSRGATMEIGTFRDRPLEDDYSGCYADVCPVGALTSKDFRFDSRVWFLDRTNSVCPECSTGCNIRVDHKNGRAHRYVPRRNPDVNQSWMCDQGRMSYSALAEGRLTALASRAETDADWPTALETLASRLRDADPGRVVGIATPRATSEELWSFQRLMSSIGTAHVDHRVDASWERVSELEDEVLRRVDHNPNTRGAELLGLTPAEGGLDVARALAQAAAGEVDVLYLLGPELLTRWPDRGAVDRALRGARFVVLHDTHARDSHDQIDLLLPSAAFAETDGTFVNHDRRLQRLHRAFAPPGVARSRVEVLGEIRSALGQRDAARTPRAAFREMAGAVDALAGLTFERIGPLGVALREGSEGEEAA